MGQKVNPVGMRLGIASEWTSRWYADSHAFADYLVVEEPEEDEDSGHHDESPFALALPLLGRRRALHFK